MAGVGVESAACPERPPATEDKILSLSLTVFAFMVLTPDADGHACGCRAAALHKRITAGDYVSKKLLSGIYSAKAYFYCIALRSVIG